MRTKQMDLIVGLSNEMSKEEELEKGRAIQAGLLAEKEIEANPNLSSEELTLLKDLILQGEDAQNYMFERHIKLANNRASKMAKQISTRYSVEDLQQDAYIALSQAIKLYNPEMNCRLSTYAFRRITKELSTKINKMRPVRLPENRMGDYLHITKAEAEYIRDHNGKYNSSEMLDYVIEKTGLSKIVIITIKTAIKGSISINAPLGEEGGEFGDLIPDKKAESVFVESDLLVNILSQLSQFDQDVLAFELGVGTPSMNLSNFMMTYNLDRDMLTDQAKLIVKKLKREQRKKKKQQELIKKNKK